MLAGSSGQTKELGPWYRQPPRMPALQGQDSWWPWSQHKCFCTCRDKGDSWAQQLYPSFSKLANVGTWKFTKYQVFTVALAGSYHSCLIDEKPSSRVPPLQLWLHYHFSCCPLPHPSLLYIKGEGRLGGQSAE